MPPTNEPPRQKESSNFLRDLVVFVIIAILIVIPIRMYVAQPFVVSGSSMYPTFKNGQYLIVNELSYHFSNPQRGDIIIFRYPLDPSQYFIKRVIGLPGEKLTLTGSKVTVCKNPPGCTTSFTLNEPYVLPADQSQNMMTVTLGPNQYFVMGDNRHASSDSRAWGPVPRNLIVGTPLFRLYPFSSLGVSPGTYTEPTGEQN